MKRTVIRVTSLLPGAVLVLVAMAQTPAARKKPTLDQYGPLNWVDPVKTEPEGTHYKIFHSRTINADVSYLIYFPPDYEEQKNTRYPVQYFLHGSGGTPHSGGALAKRTDKAIRAHRADPFIMVFVNGLAGDTMYCDARIDKYPLETVIMKDLIPHVDATYRTIASREGRAVAGFSMGGFGAAHLGFKYPEVFGIISIEAPALLGPSITVGSDAIGAWAKLFPTAMGSDMEYFKENDPFTLAVKNADALRDRTLIRIATHRTNGNWQSDRCEELHELLYKQMIPHEFYFESNVRQHNIGLVMDSMGDTAFTLFSTGLPRWQTTHPEK